MKLGDLDSRLRGHDIAQAWQRRNKLSEQGKSDNGGEKSAPYVVLARKYRPSSFEGLIGQDAMVTTLKNAFATDRIAQGYMLTGVRGVGKTTTARILSRALNYERDGVDKPTFDMAEFGRHCAEIMEGRHPDVLEMDAASNTGVDNMREIIESARYKPMLARYKVYLIDEVHMLSKGAFNALLKTLEEPPGHVKFIFATTEVRKVPLTVLSRCQRFDLRRVEVPVLMEHFKKIIANEGGEAEDEALAAIARAAEGSVRDGLSLLDQALAMSAGNVRLERVRDMLGLADRGPHLRSSREAAGRSHRRGARDIRRPASRRRRARPDPGRPRRGRAHHHARQDAGRDQRRRGPLGRGAAPRRGAGRAAVGGDPRARLAAAAQGARRACPCTQPGGRRGDGADPPGLYRRLAGARRYHQRARRQRPARRGQARARARREAPPVGRRSTSWRAQPKKRA